MFNIVHRIHLICTNKDCIFQLDIGIITVSLLYLQDNQNYVHTQEYRLYNYEYMYNSISISSRYYWNDCLAKSVT